MKIHKMPENYVICECGCEFEFDIFDIFREKSHLDDVNFPLKYVTCPICKIQIDIKRNIKNTQSPKESNNILNEMAAGILILKMEQLLQAIIANMVSIGAEKNVKKLKEFIKETNDKIDELKNKL